MTGLPVYTFRLLLLFSFQDLQAPCLSAEPDDSRIAISAIKTPTFRRAGHSSLFAGRLPFKPRLDFQVAPHQPEEYSITLIVVKPLRETFLKSRREDHGEPVTSLLLAGRSAAFRPEGCCRRSRRGSAWNAHRL